MTSNIIACVLLTIFWSLSMISLKCLRTYKSSLVNTSRCKSQPAITNRLYFPVRVYCNRSQMTSQCVKNKKYGTRRSRVLWLLFFTRCDVFCDLLQYTRTEKFNTIKIQMVYWRWWGILGAWTKKNEVRWCDLTWIWRNLFCVP